MLPPLVEPRTSLSFALRRAPIPGASEPATLLGADVRCMLGMCYLAMARAYVFGLYASDAAVAAAAGAAASGAPGADGLTRVLDVLHAAHVRAIAGTGGNHDETPSVGELSLVLIMARDIPGQHLSHGFINSVVARLPAVDKRAAALQLGGSAGGGAGAGVGAAVDAGDARAAGAVHAVRQHRR